MANATVQLDRRSVQIVESLVASGEFADAEQAVNAVLHRLQDRASWLQRELALGEESGRTRPYTPTLLDELEQRALDAISSGNLTIRPSVAPVDELLRP